MWLHKLLFSLLWGLTEEATLTIPSSGRIFLQTVEASLRVTFFPLLVHISI